MSDLFWQYCLQAHKLATMNNNCETDYGEVFTACKTDLGWECCFVGEKSSTDITSETDTNLRVDCFQQYGENFEDCERDWGWDCCMKDDALTANLANLANSATIKYNQEPIDCFQKYGEEFQDCQTAMGWDCCVVGDELDDTDLSNNKVAFPATNTCSQELGPEFTDCGHGYGLDCCYVDDGTFKHDHNNDHASKSESTNLTDSGHLQDFDAFYAVQERKSCVEQFGANFTDCGNTYGLDCCYIDDGVLFYDHTMHLNSVAVAPTSVLRWLVITAVIAFAVIHKMQRKRSRGRSRSRVGVSKARTSYDYDDNDDVDDDDSNNGDEVELKPLI